MVTRFFFWGWLLLRLSFEYVLLPFSLLLLLLLMEATGRKVTARPVVKAQLVALLPAATAPVEAIAPIAPMPQPIRCDGLSVIELRQLARAMGHKALARSGRRADLIAVLGG